MSRGWSLSGRLTRRLTATIVVGWLASIAVGVLVMAHEMREVQEQALEGEARMALAFLRAAGPGQPLPLERGEEARVVSGGRVLSDAPWPPLGADGAAEIGPWHVLRRSAGDLAVEIGQPTALRQDELRESARAFVVLMLPFLALVLLVLHPTLRRALAPARRFAESVAGRDARDVTRVEGGDLPRELAPIPEALNLYLERIRSLLATERAFADHAAHELRTPLAAASAQAQLIAAGTSAPEAGTQLAAALGKLAQTVERLLQLSRAEAGIGAADASCDLVTVLRLVIDTLAPGSLRFDDGDIETCPVAIDPDLLGVLLGNLIGNARLHGTGRVEITLRPGPVVTVANPVAAGAAFREAAFDKDPASPGAGLGLAIVRAIAAQNRLRLTLAIAEGTATARIDLGAVSLAPLGAGTLVPGDR